MMPPAVPGFPSVAHFATSSLGGLESVASFVLSSVLSCINLEGSSFWPFVEVKCIRAYKVLSAVSNKCQLHAVSHASGPDPRSIEINLDL